MLGFVEKITFFFFSDDNTSQGISSTVAGLLSPFSRPGKSQSNLPLPPSCPWCGVVEPHSSTHPVYDSSGRLHAMDQCPVPPEIILVNRVGVRGWWYRSHEGLWQNCFILLEHREKQSTWQSNQTESCSHLWGGSNACSKHQMNGRQENEVIITVKLGCNCILALSLLIHIWFGARYLP